MRDESNETVSRDLLLRSERGQCEFSSAVDHM